ncbi:hypothetical protein AB0M95_30695 [Sphaerisporangium sp. NPDC051017]|uniref:hypothetical protein n=1 Tax=Sphaerisporangium sp. NPDC051017 TaxID=3154636 RepID=UPI00343443E9
MDAHDHDAAEGPAFAAGQPASVEDVSDLSVGVVVEQLVDRRDDLLVGLTLCPGGFRNGDGEGVILIAGEAESAGSPTGLSPMARPSR